MGMAASQARFLGLTARKTNVEYEGQQINQQRTTLSNQSANYYNQLLGMSVPVPPSVADYTKTVYTFQDGSLSNSITSMIAKGSGNYMISYVSSWMDDFAAVKTASSIVTKAGGDYYVGSQKLRCLCKNCSKDDMDKNDPYLKTLSDDQLEQLKKEEEEYLKILQAQYGGTGDDSSWYVRYVQNTTTGTWSPYFYKKSDLESAVYSDNGSSLSNIEAYTIGSAQKTEEIKNVTARMEQDATGRIINITLNPGKENEVTYAVTTNTLTDQAKYDDAMNQYEYDKYQYDQAIQEINAKIEIIQSEDKNLELRLKQLDTEQDAISNEMDAVEKVIQKNTESTFKTFG